MGLFDGIGLKDIMGPAVSLVGGLLGYGGQQSANETNMALGREQMAFQERMRATQYQTAVGDLKKAGLNPMLAYQNGGAGNLPGAMPNVQNAMGAGLNAAAAASDVMNKVGQNDLIKAQVLQTLQDTRTSESTAKHIDTAVERLIQEIRRRDEYGGQSFFERGLMLDRERGFYDVRAREAESRYADLFYKARAEGLGAEAAISRYGIAPAKRESDYAENTGWLSPALRDFSTASGGVARLASARRGAAFSSFKREMERPLVERINPHTGEVYHVRPRLINRR